MYVVNGCCDCVNGGRDLAVSRVLLEEFRGHFVCSGRCTMKAALPPCGSGSVECDQGLCVYLPPPRPFVLPSEASERVEDSVVGE